MSTVHANTTDKLKIGISQVFQLIGKRKDALGSAIPEDTSDKQTNIISLLASAKTLDDFSRLNTLIQEYIEALPDEYTDIKYIIQALMDLERQHHQLNKQWKCLYRITNTLSDLGNRLSEEHIWDIILKEAQQILDIRYLSVVLRDKSTSEYHFVILNGSKYLKPCSQGEFFLGLNLEQQIQKIFNSEKPASLHTRQDILEQFSESHDSHDESSIPGTWIGVPMRVGDNVTGAFIYHPQDELPYAEDFIEVLDAFSDEAAIALEWRSVNAKERALVELAKDLTKEPQHLSEQEIIELLYKHASHVMDTSNMVIALRTEGTDTLHFNLAHNLGRRLDAGYASDEISKSPHNIFMTEIVKTTQANKTFLLHTKQDVAAALQSLITDSIDDNILPASLLAVPMRLGHRKEGTRVIGVICVYHQYKENSYTKIDEEILDALSDQAAIAIENTRLYLNAECMLTQKTQQLDAQNKKLTGLLSIMRAYTNTISSKILMPEADILRVIRDNAALLMDTNNMYIALYDEDSNTISFPIFYKNGNSEVQPTREFKYKKRGKTEEIIINQKPIIHYTANEAKDWYSQPEHEEYSNDPLASWIGVPIKTKDRVLGVVAAYHPTAPNIYKQSDLDILEAMADHAAITLENSRLYKTVERQAKNLEIANRQIAENQDALTKSIIADDFVHRVNNLAGTIPYWVNEVKGHLNSLTLHDSILADLHDCLQHIEDDNADLLRFAEKIKEPTRKERIDISALLETIVRQAKVHYYEIAEDIQLKTDISNNLYNTEAIPSLLGNALFVLISHGLDRIIDLSALDKSQKTLTLIASNYRDKSDYRWISIELVSSLPSKIYGGDFIPYEDDIGETSSLVASNYNLWNAKMVITDLGGKIAVMVQNSNSLFKLLLPGLSPEDEK